MSSEKTIQRSRKKLPPVPGLNGNKLSMVVNGSGFGWQYIFILMYRVSDQTSALARVRIGATNI
jgi:hypothetical protein